MVLLSSASDPKWRSELFITPLLRFDRSTEDFHLGDLEFMVYIISLDVRVMSLL
jgi:hypothetical protein